MSETDQKRILPRSDLDFNLMTTDSVWGSPYVNQELKDKVKQYRQAMDKEGNLTVESDSLWSMLGFFTRDMRLANLDRAESNYCHYYLDLANDFLHTNQSEPFIICLERVASILELSQSKKGFLRKRMNTLTTESFNQQEPPKTKFAGQQSKKHN